MAYRLTSSSLFYNDAEANPMQHYFQASLKAMNCDLTIPDESVEIKIKIK